MSTIAPAKLPQSAPRAVESASNAAPPKGVKHPSLAAKGHQLSDYMSPVNAGWLKTNNCYPTEMQLPLKDKEHLKVSCEVVNFTLRIEKMDYVRSEVLLTKAGAAALNKYDKTTGYRAGQPLVRTLTVNDEKGKPHTLKDTGIDEVEYRHTIADGKIDLVRPILAKP